MRYTYLWHAVKYIPNSASKKKKKMKTSVFACFFFNSAYSLVKKSSNDLGLEKLIYTGLVQYDIFLHLWTFSCIPS